MLYISPQEQIIKDLKNRVLVTGCGGQIGTVLVRALRELYGNDNVIATDLRNLEIGQPFELLDVTDDSRLDQLIQQYEINEIYHLAALLSSKGEQNINLTWQINFNSYKNLLELAVKNGVNKVFFPSTIGIFGATTPKQLTPQNTSFEPSTIYGISKYNGELWGAYYKQRFGLDVRSIRYPGVISYEVIPSGGTTDFAVEMFFDALKKQHYDCYLEADSMLPMIYMPDVIKATLGLMTADESKISTGMGYNLTGFSVTPLQLFEKIKQHIPELTISYQPDHRQQIADSWSETIDDSLAKNDWGWEPDFNLDKTVESMLENIKSTLTA